MRKLVTILVFCVHVLTPPAQQEASSVKPCSLAQPNGKPAIFAAGVSLAGEASLNKVPLHFDQSGVVSGSHTMPGPRVSATQHRPMRGDNVDRSEGYIATVDGIRLYFQKLGQGTRAIIIPNGIYLYHDFKYLAEHHTLILYDLRNRGQSDPVTDPTKLARGIHNDVDDLEAVRQHFGISKPVVLGHSYVGLMVVLFAMKYPDHNGGLIQIGPAQPSFGRQYPPHLTGVDDTLRDVLAKLGQLQKERRTEDPVEFCNKFWSLLRLIYVENAADAGRINWGRCELPNERGSLKYWTESIQPSLQTLRISAEDAARVEVPVLTIHGRNDRSAPYGGGRDWALILPNARLVTIEKAGHAPWIEAPEKVFNAIKDFLDGGWPESAEHVRSLDPCDEPATKQPCFKPNENKP